MTDPNPTSPSRAREPTPPPAASTSVSSRPETRCAAPGCTLTLTRTGRGRPTRYCSPTCRTAAHREHRRHRNQPLRVETDPGSTSAKGRPGGRVWLVRLRRGHRAVIIATGLTRPAAEHLTHQINQLLHPPPHSAGHPARNGIDHARTGAPHAKNLDTDDTTNVNDLTSPTSPKQGISLSNNAEFRRASSPDRQRASGASLLRRLESATERIRRLEEENVQLRESLALALGERRAADVLGNTRDTPRNKSVAIIGPG